MKTPLEKLLEPTSISLPFYLTWLPKQYLNSSLWKKFPELGPLQKHFRFVHRSSHKLARTLFYFMGKYRDELEQEQSLLGKLMEIGTELFAISATCSFAHQLYQKNSDESPLQLAKHFCEGAEKRIHDHFQNLKIPRKNPTPLTEDILQGKMQWLEDGIIEIGEAS